MTGSNNEVVDEDLSCGGVPLHLNFVIHYKVREFTLKMAHPLSLHVYVYGYFTVYYDALNGLVEFTVNG